MEPNLLFIPGAAYVETRTGRSEGEVLRVIPDIDSNKREDVRIKFNKNNMTDYFLV